jgi:hypothetical protein
MTCHERFARSINYCYKNGVQMIIPGHGVRVVRTYLAAICGDKPALHAMVGLKTGNCHRQCHICCFDRRRNIDPYDDSIHKKRDFTLLLNLQAICADYLMKLEAGEDVSALQHDYSKASKFLTYYGAIPLVTPFSRAPLGWGDPSAVFKTAVRDIFHDLEAGLFPSIVMMVLRIIQAISEHDSRYHDAISLLDEFTSSKRVSRHPPRYKKMDHTTFHEGCASMLLGTSTGQANSGATGTTAGMRSSWSKVMMTALLVAVGTSNGLILPQKKHYVIKRQVKVTTTKKVTTTQEDITKRRTITETHTRNNDADIGDPTRLCTQVLSIALDVYAEFNRSLWTPSIVTHVEQKVRELQSYMTVLHQVMVSCCRVSLNEEDYQVRPLSSILKFELLLICLLHNIYIQSKVGKLHAISHIPSLGLIYGDLSQVSCHGRESSHRTNVTEVFWNTSARRDTHSTEMNTKLITSVMHDMTEFTADMRESAMATAAQISGPSPTNIYEYEFFMKHVAELPASLFRPPIPTFRRPKGASSAIVFKDHQDFTVPHGSMIAHPSALFHYERRLDIVLNVSHVMCYRGFEKLSLISSLICTGSDESAYEEEVIHCTQNLKGAGSAFSFVQIAREDGGVVLGRVAAITEVLLSSGCTKYLLDIHILKLMDASSKRRDYRYIHWDVYEWDLDPETGAVKLETIPIESFVDNVRMEPCMYTKASGSSTDPSDRFVYLPREFFERRGTTCCRGAYEGIDLVDPDSAKRWIKRRAARGPMIPEIEFPAHSEILQMISPLDD